MKHIHTLLLTLGLPLLARAAPPDEAATAPEDPPVVAVLNGAPIDLCAVWDAADRETNRPNVDAPPSAEALLDRLIRDRLLRAAAIAEGQLDDPVVRRLLVDLAYDHQVGALVETRDLSEESVRAWYQAHIEDFTEEAQVHVVVRRVSTGPDLTAEAAAARAEALRQKLQLQPGQRFQSKDWEKVGDHEDVAFYPYTSQRLPGKIDPAVLAVAWDLPVGIVSAPVPVESGFAVAMVLRRDEARARPLSQVLETVQDRIRREAWPRRKAEYEAWLRERAADDRRIEALIVDHALELGLLSDRAVQHAQQGALERRLIEAPARAAVDEDAARRYFDAHAREFIQPEQIDLAMIRISAGDQRRRAQARALAHKLRRLIVDKPDAFDDVARSMSNDRSRGWGGRFREVGREGRADLDPAVVDAAWILPEGGLSPVLRVGDSFVLVRLNHRKEAYTPGFESLKARIRQIVIQQEEDARRIAVTEPLWAAAQVQTFPEALQALDLSSFPMLLPLDACPGS